MMDTIARTSVCVALALFLALFSYPDEALAETWYCTLTDDPTISVYGQKIKAYRVDGDKVVNLTDEEDDKKIFDNKEDNELLRELKLANEFNVLRNDEARIVAESAYNWNAGININVIVIEKRSGFFLSATIFTWNDQHPTESYKGVCTKG